MSQRDQYFNNAAIGRSLLLPFSISPLAGATALTLPKKNTDAMLFGRAFHAMMEGQKSFEMDFRVFDDREVCEQIGGAKPRSTTKYREWLDSQTDGRESIALEDFFSISKMVANIKASKFYENTVTASASASVGFEVPFYATIDGLDFKCLADCVIEREKSILVIDWKKTRLQLTPSPRDIAHEVKKWFLHFQQYHYTRVIQAATGKKVSFVFVFSEDSAPFDCVPVLLSPDSELLISAEFLWTSAVKNYRAYLAGDVFGIEYFLDNNLLILE
jgi:predicted peroxiredoxin